MSKFTQKEILKSLYFHFKQPYMGYNTYALGDFEADFIAITKAGFVHEVEIKLTSTDFKADFEKTVKVGRYPYRKIVHKHAGIQEGKYSNYFWFVMPKDMVPVEDIPAYAGVIFMTLNKSGSVKLKVARPATRIHKNKISDESKIKILRSMMYKAWNNYVLKKDK